MTASALAVILVNGLFLVAGVGVLRALGGWRTPRGLFRRFGVAYMAGLAAVGTALQLALVVGIPFGVPLVLGVCLALAAAGLVRSRPADPRSVPLPLREIAVPAGIAVATIGLLAVDAVFQPLAVWDAWAQWTAKAKALVLFDGLETAYLASAPYQPWNPDYPIALPALEAAGFVFMGEFDTQVIHLQFWFVLAGFALALTELLRERIATALVYPFVLLVVLAPSVQNFTAGALADVPMGAFFALAGVCGWRWLHEHDAVFLRLLVLFAAVTMAIKVEGRIFVAALLVGLAVTVASRRRRLTVLAAGAIAAAVSLVPWLLWTAATDVRGLVSSSPADVLRSDLIEHAGRVPTAGTRLAVEGLDPRSWLVLVPLALAAAVVARRGSPGERGVQLVGWTTALAIAGLVLAYWSTPLDFEWHLRQSAHRVVTGPVLFLAAVTPLLLASALDRAGYDTTEP